LALGDVVALRQMSTNSKRRQKMKLFVSVSIVWGVAVICSPLQVMVSMGKFTGVKLFAFAGILLASMISSAGSLRKVLMSLRVQMTHRTTEPGARALATRSFWRLALFTLSLHTMLLAAIVTQIYVGVLEVLYSKSERFFTVDGQPVSVPETFPPQVLAFGGITMIAVTVNLAFFWSVSPPTAPTQEQVDQCRADFADYSQQSAGSGRSFSSQASVYLISASFVSDRGHGSQHDSRYSSNAQSQISEAPSSGASL
jgi:hypothetical protein